LGVSSANDEMSNRARGVCRELDGVSVVPEHKLRRRLGHERALQPVRTLLQEEKTIASSNG